MFFLFFSCGGGVVCAPIWEEERIEEQRAQGLLSGGNRASAVFLAGGEEAIVSCVSKTS